VSASFKSIGMKSVLNMSKNKICTFVINQFDWRMDLEELYSINYIK
jgi:hypothetical protein